MERLYRFISFPAFINLVEQQEERYVLPSTWEDTYEGYLFHLLNKENIKDCLTLLINAINKNCPESAADNYIRLFFAQRFCYGQCWTLCPESDAFWRIYSYDKMAIRIETDEEQIRTIFSSEQTNKFNITIDNVFYDLDKRGITQTKNELIEQLKNTKRIQEPYFHKRTAFEHEREKRVIFFDPTKNPIITLSTYSVLNNYRRGIIGREMTLEEQIDAITNEVQRIISPQSQIELDKMLFIPIPVLTDYIKSVMVHPQAEPWIVSLVEKICKRTGLNFLGKSHMYDSLA